MTVRVQVILDEAERALIQKEAEGAHTSLSAWIRQAALGRLKASQQERHLSTLEELRRFFDECDQREVGREPDWQEHLEVMTSSRGTGSTST